MSTLSAVLQRRCRRELAREVVRSARPKGQASTRIEVRSGVAIMLWYIEIDPNQFNGDEMPTIGRMEKLFLRALREVLPQYRMASDEFLQSKLEKRIYPATEELVCLLESGGAGTGLKNDVICAALMTA